MGEGTGLRAGRVGTRRHVGARTWFIKFSRTSARSTPFSHVCASDEEPAAGLRTLGFLDGRAMGSDEASAESGADGAVAPSSTTIASASASIAPDVSSVGATLRLPLGIICKGRTEAARAGRRSWHVCGDLRSEMREPRCGAGATSGEMHAERKAGAGAWAGERAGAPARLRPVAVAGSEMHLTQQSARQTRAEWRRARENASRDDRPTLPCSTAWDTRASPTLPSIHADAYARSAQDGVQAPEVA